jgi:hypothetical protein
MKNLVKIEPKNQIRSDFVFDNSLRESILDALHSVENARQKCFIAGQKLQEAKAKYEHGDFLERVVALVPEVTVRTAQTWMRATANILKTLPPPAIDVESSVTVSAMLTLPDEELTPAQREFKQSWFNFTADKTIKDAAAGIFVDGDEAHRMDRAVNGKTKGGRGSAAASDRKAFEKFTATKLSHITTFLTVQKKMAGTGSKKIVGWRNLSPTQKTQINAVFNHFWETAPRDLLENSFDKIREELKLTDAQRLAR